MKKVIIIGEINRQQKEIIDFAVNLGRTERVIENKNSDVVPCGNPKMILTTNEYLQNFERGNQ